MGLLWTEGVSGFEKINNTVFSIPALLMLVNAFGLRNFLPDPSFQHFSLLIAVGVTVWMAIWLLYGRSVGELKPTAKWYTYSRKKRCVAILAAPFLITLFNYVAIGYTLPHLVTRAMGEPGTVAYEVVRDRGGGRYSCEYQITNDEMKVPFFELCVSEGIWNRLPDIPFRAEFSVKKSSLGTIFKEIRVKEKGGAERSAVWSDVGF